MSTNNILVVRNASALLKIGELTTWVQNLVYNIYLYTSYNILYNYVNDKLQNIAIVLWI